MNLSSYIQNLFESFITSHDESLGNILFLRDYTNAFSQNEEAKSRIIKDFGKGFCFHSFSLEAMLSPYEPFLDAIKYYYDLFYADKMSVDEFVENCNIYKLHQIIFSSYLKSEHAQRPEAIIISEVEYEKKRMLQSIFSAINYIASEHKIILIMTDFQYAGLSTLQFLKYVITSDAQCKAKLLITFNDNKIIPSYRQEAFEDILYIADERSIIFDLETTSFSDAKAYSSFSPISIMMNEYNDNYTNLYHFMCLEDMDYYMDIIHSRIIEENFIISDKNAFYFYAFSALCSVMLGNENRAVFMCERLTLYYDKKDDSLYDFNYNYINSVIHISLKHSELGAKYAQLCLNKAMNFDNEDLLFTAKVLLCSAQFGGWRTLFSVNFSSITCDENFANELREHKFYNTLAYYLVYGFDNDSESIKAIASGKLTPTYKEAFNLINELGNTALLLSAYTKYIVLLNKSGYHSVVNKFYDAKLQVLTHEENKRRMANLFMGKGYNNIINENFMAANESFIKAVKILYQLKDPEAIAEALYNMVINCFCANDFTSAKELTRVLFKILSNLNLKSVQISSPAKLYALDAISQFKTGSEYRCFLSLKKIKKLVDIRTGNNIDKLGKDYLSNNPHEDFFLYSFISAILSKASNQTDKALEEFKSSLDTFVHVASVSFYLFTFYICEYYDLLISTGDNDGAAKLLEFAYDHCEKNGFKIKKADITAHIEGKPMTAMNFSKSFDSDELNDIIAMSFSIGKERQLLKDKKNIWFLSSWQELLNHDNFTTNELMDNAFNTFQDNFNFENMLYVEIDNKTPNVLYHNFDNANEGAASIFEYFKQYRKEFIANCTDKDFYTYESFLKIVDNNDTFTIIGIPVFQEDSLIAFFAGTINNQNHDISLLNSDDLSIMRTAIIQVHYAIDRIKSRERIISINEKLNELAVTDLLTGIYNRQGMAKIMDFNKNSDTLVSILYIDLDNFKFYNDNFGHDSGDFILKEFANMLRNIVGEIGHVIRYGGDEFLILLYNSTIDIAVDTAKNIYANITSYLIPKLRDYIGMDAVIPQDKLLTCSIGISEADNSSTAQIYSSLKKADDALYSMKKTTKGNYCVWNENI